MTTVTAKPARPFFGWWVVGGAMGLQALFGGLLHMVFGAYIVPLQTEFGWSRTSVAAAFSLQQVESGALGPIQGWLLGRFGPRNVVRIGLVLAVVGFLLFSQTQSLFGFYFSFVILSLGSGLAGFLSLTTTVVPWFRRRRTLALALVPTGTSVAGTLAPLIALGMATAGWRATAIASAVIILVVGMPLTFLLRNRPEQYGQVPDGADEPVDETPGAPAPINVDFTANQALRTPAFWLIGVGHSCGALVYASVAVHLVSAIIAFLDVSLEAAATGIAGVTIMFLVGQLLAGIFGDRYDKRWLIIVCMVSMLVGMVFLATANSVWMIAAFAVSYGVSLGARGPLMLSIRADYFGSKHFGQIAGYSMLMVTVGTVLGPLLVGSIADATGSYRPGFAVLTIITTVGAVCFYLARRPEPLSQIAKS